MRNITSLIDHTLMVMRPRPGKPLFELRFGDETVAVLTLTKSLKNNGSVKGADGEWIIEEKKRGQGITVKSADRETTVAEYAVKIWSGKRTLLFPDGLKIPIKVNAWRTRTSILTESEELLAELWNEGAIRPNTRLRMNRHTRRPPHFPLIILFGMYVHVIETRKNSYY